MHGDVYARMMTMMVYLFVLILYMCMLFFKLTYHFVLVCLCY